MNGEITRAEIFQQPETWLDTVQRVAAAARPVSSAPVITGAGSSYFASMAVEAAWPGSRAVASTELFLDFRGRLAEDGVVLSLARSGNSPESVAVVDKIQRAMPGVRHLAITCDGQGKLAQWPGVEAIVLDPRTNDRSLVMTDSYSNMALAGICLARPSEAQAAAGAIAAGGRQVLQDHEAATERFAAALPARLVTLASEPLAGAAREAWLKVLEITAGRVAALCESYLGVRHGPLSFIQEDSIVLCFLSSDARRRRYEIDLVCELHAKKLGRLVALGGGVPAGLFEHVVCTEASALPDYLRTPAEIVFPQLLAYHLSLRLGLNPDSPSPGGVINRVVQGVTIYED